MPDLLKPEHFQQLGAPLVIANRAGEIAATIELKVTAVKPMPAHRFRQEPFSVTLSGPREPLLPQASYAVKHPTLGMIDLFLVPAAQDAHSTQYEVTFN
ncbi:MAG: hypothetical protein ABL931_02215 [Usitatibacteraceae bacterium]